MIALRGGRAVGRISAQITRCISSATLTQMVFRCWTPERAGAFAALLGTAERWLMPGMRRARGPFNLSINEEMGLLVEGFATPPVFMMGHARPYYAGHVQRVGYRKAVDALAYMISSDFEASPVMQRLVAASAHRVRVRPRPQALRRRLLRDIFNDAWAENWGSCRSPPQNSTSSTQSSLSRRPELIQIAEVDGEAVAFAVVIPNVNEAIQTFAAGCFRPAGQAAVATQVRARARPGCR
jgi:hypothetical protein